METMSGPGRCFVRRGRYRRNQTISVRWMLLDRHNLFFAISQDSGQRRCTQGDVITSEMHNKQVGAATAAANQGSFDQRQFHLQLTFENYEFLLPLTSFLFSHDPTLMLLSTVSLQNCRLHWYQRVIRSKSWLFLNDHIVLLNTTVSLLCGQLHWYQRVNGSKSWLFLNDR